MSPDKILGKQQQSCQTESSARSPRLAKSQTPQTAELQGAEKLDTPMAKRKATYLTEKATTRTTKSFPDTPDLADIEAIREALKPYLIALAQVGEQENTVVFNGVHYTIG